MTGEKEISVVQTTPPPPKTTTQQHQQNGISSQQVLFQNDTVHFSTLSSPSKPPLFHHNLFLHQPNRPKFYTGGGGGGIRPGDGGSDDSGDDDDVENNDDDDEEEGDGSNEENNSGSSEGVMVLKETSAGPGQAEGGSNGITVANPGSDVYYSSFLHSMEGCAGGGGVKDVNLGDNGCGFSGRKEISSFSSDSGESLRAILSDPVTGALMDDAVILPCGHSFGGGGIQHVIKMKACYTCSKSISEDSISLNLSLRAAVLAFQREELSRSFKRRRERFDQEKGNVGDPGLMDVTRNRVLQFPFVVTDRVIIKGNKRTPPRFVGREAIVTTQCLNGWYVVKTLDNAESVKLQYRSLAKVSDGSSLKATTSKMSASWT